MSFYKNIFKKKIVIAGRSKGASPSFLMPPDGTNVKQGHQIYEAVDLLCEGEVEGLVDQEGEVLTDLAGNTSTTVTKEFSHSNSNNNLNTIDKGFYYDDTPLRDSSGKSTHTKYKIEFKSGKILQSESKIKDKPSKLIKVGAKIKGEYNMTADGNARNGLGSRDVRDEGKKGRDFVSWQNYTPKETKPKPYRYTNYDKDVGMMDVGLQIDALSDTVSKSTKEENKAGASKMGSPMPISVTFEVVTGRAESNGNIAYNTVGFTVRPGKGRTIGASGTGTVKVTGVVTAPYTLTLENISLPSLSESALYNFVEIRKLEFETVSNLVRRDAGVATITLKYNDTYYYPGSCYAVTQIDSQYHPQVPARTFRLKGKKIKIPSNYNPVVNGTDQRFGGIGRVGQQIYSQNGQWDGNFKYGWSDNPAWIYYDLLTNKRYGLGSYLRDIDIIDKWTLYEIGMYCDAVTMNDGSKTTNDAGGAGRFIGLDDGFGGLEPRFSCNILIKDQTNAFDALQNLARSFRAMTYFNNSCVSVKVDRPYFFEDFNNTSNSAPKENKFPPHLIFNNLNVKDGMFSYADVDRSTKLSAVEVSFLDKRRNFTSATEYVEDHEAIKSVGLNFKQIDGIGITSRGQAHRLAQYILFESQHTTETVSFNAGLEALLVQPGDIIRVEDEMKQFHRNYGTVLRGSGLSDYYDPDSTSIIQSSVSGKGPTAIFVEPAIGSDLNDYVTGGNIHIYNPVGVSGIEDFYRNPGSNSDLYREIHNPQVMSLKIKPGGSGTSYEVTDSGVAIFINGLETFSNGSTGSQWYSERDANIRHGSVYNIDSSGVAPKYYRVLNISEDKNLGFNVSATIHHTGKFKLVEEGIKFDLDGDTFQPNLKTSDAVRPNAPLNVTTGALVQPVGEKSLNLNLTITDPGTKVPDRYVVIMEEPNQNVVTSSFFKSNTTQTNVVLSGASKIDQIGNYTLSVFSESSQPITARSTLSFDLQFQTELDDFNFNNQDAFTEYKDISIKTDFTSTFNRDFETGIAQNSFIQNNPDINAVVNLEFEDIFGNDGGEVQSTVTAQRINILDHQRNVKKLEYKNLANDGSFEILNSEIDEAFSYTGDGRYRVPSGIIFEVGSFTMPAANSVSRNINLELDYGSTVFGSVANVPAVFIQQKASGSFRDVFRPLTRNGADNNTLFVQLEEENPHEETKYGYFASITGNYILDAKKIEIDFVNKNSNSGFQFVQFNEAFSTTPTIVIQLQKSGGSYATERGASQTCITGASPNGFWFAAFQDNDEPASGTGQYAYIAVDQLAFNNTSSTDLPLAVLNYAATGHGNYTFGNPILNQFNGSEPSVTDALFNHSQYMVLCQRSGEDTDLQDKFFVVHETANQNRLHQQIMTTGLDTGIRCTEIDGANNHVLITGFDDSTNTDLINVGTGDFTMMAWVKFDPGLDGKQYLLESHKNGTGIAWFQSGDGNNYVNLNGTDYLAITGQAGASLNDGNLHHLQIFVDRDAGLSGHLDGITETFSVGNENSGILDLIDGFTISDVGQGMPGNTADFDGTYTRDGDLYVNDATSGLRVKKTGSNNTWVLCDDDTSNSYTHNRIAWSGGQNVGAPTGVQTWTGNVFTDGFTLGGVGSGMSNNPNSFNGSYEGFGSEYTKTSNNNLRVKISGGAWIIFDNNVGYGFDENGDPLTYSHNRIAWSGGSTADSFPSDVQTWSGGSTIADGTITDSSTPTFTLTSAAFPGTNAPSFSDEIFASLNAQTGFKILGNSELPGNALTSGHIINYIGLSSGNDTSNLRFSTFNSFEAAKTSTRTKFILDVEEYEITSNGSNIIDISTVNTATVSIVGDVERSQAILDRNKSSNFNFLQVGVSGTL